MPADEKPCACSRCFLQSQFVPLVLGAASLLACTFCVYIMLHFKDDGDIIWAQGIFGQLIAAFLVSLVGAPRPTQHQGDTIKAGDNATITAAPAAPEGDKT